ncbi:hypothetical protein GCM10009775_32910 [Microbacterium aoyamense]|uniref:Helix-turn-helix domain-containing protein n=1 Tax=Microbacterium aoyamense TaxID=344166 RepID=A0ABN2PZC0_9MICO|nr:helix-turn-helix domain-containing protein [Microbacterium aoyamense]
MDTQLPQRAVSPEGAAHYLSMPPATLAYWRSIGVGPSWVRLGRRVRYDLADLDAFIERNKQHAQAS